MDVEDWVMAIATKAGVRVDLSAVVPDNAEVFPWSFAGPGEFIQSTELGAVGPGYVCVHPDLVYQSRGIDNVLMEADGWAYLLHEIGHAFTASDNEAVVAGWTHAVLVEVFGDGSAEVWEMDEYDRCSISSQVTKLDMRTAAFLAGVIDAEGRPIWPILGEAAV